MTEYLIKCKICGGKGFVQRIDFEYDVVLEMGSEPEQVPNLKRTRIVCTGCGEVGVIVTAISDSGS